MSFVWAALAAATATAGPWVRDPGAHYVKVGASHFVAGVYDDPSVSDDAGLAYTGQLATLYAEVGLPQGLQLVVQGAVAQGRNVDPATGWIYRSRGPGDLGVGLVADVPWIDAPLSVSLTTRVPLYDDGVDATLHPALGDPQVDVDAGVSAGQALPLGPHWIWFVEELGFRWRTSVVPSQHLVLVPRNAMTYRAQVGLAPYLGERPLGWVNVDVSGVWSPLADSRTPSFHLWSAGLAGTVWRGLSVEAGFQHIYAATNASTGWGVNAGVSWKGKPPERGG